jgi:hypothetical protein
MINECLIEENEKEAAVAHFEPLSRHMSGGMQEDHEI